MRIGKDFNAAVRQAHANAKLGRRPWFVHEYAGDWWISKGDGPKGQLASLCASGFTIVYPNGIWESYDPAKGIPEYDLRTGNKVVPQGETHADGR